MQQITSILLALLLVSALFLLLLLHITQLLTRDRLRSRLLPKHSIRSLNKSHSIDQTPLLTKFTTPTIRPLTLACRSPIKKNASTSVTSNNQLQCKCNYQQNNLTSLQNAFKQQQTVLQQQLQQQLAGLERRLKSTIDDLREARCSDSCYTNRFMHECNVPSSNQTFKNDLSYDNMQSCPLHDCSTLTHSNATTNDRGRHGTKLNVSLTEHQNIMEELKMKALKRIEHMDEEGKKHFRLSPCLSS